MIKIRLILALLFVSIGVSAQTNWNAFGLRYRVSGSDTTWYFPSNTVPVKNMSFYSRAQADGKFAPYSGNGYVELNPASQQSGGINIGGGIQSFGLTTRNSLTFDNNTSGGTAQSILYRHSAGFDVFGYSATDRALTWSRPFNLASLNITSTPATASNTTQVLTRNPTTGVVESTDLNNKQNTLVSGTNIKTINNINILGSGNIDVSGGGGGPASWGSISGNLADQTDLITALNGKQNSLTGTGFVKSTAGTISYDNTSYYPASNPNGYITSVPAQSFASLTGKPTTLSGYGITDAYPLTGNPSGFLTTETDPTVPAYAKSLTAFSVIKTSTDALYEPIFSKNTAFNRNFGTTANTVTEGNDSRVNNGQTAFGWGNHATQGYVTASSTNTFTNKSGNITQWTNNANYINEARVATGQTIGANTTGSAVKWSGIPYTGVSTNSDYFFGYDSSLSEAKLLTASSLKQVLNTTLEDVTNNGNTTPYNIIGIGENSFFSWDSGANRRIGFVKKSGFGPAIAFGNGDNFYISESNASSILPANMFTPRFTIVNGGDVGIGTTTPSAKLHVVGNSNIDGTIFTDIIRPYNTNILTILAGGSNRLDVNGSARVANNDGSSTGVVRNTDLANYATTTYVDGKVQNNLTASTTVAPSATAVNNGLATANTYADGKVANDLTASTTVAPSKTAVNSALATKQNNLTLTTTGTGGTATLSGSTLNIPVIPTNNNQLTNGRGYLTSSDLPTITSGTYTPTTTNANATMGTATYMRIGDIVTVYGSFNYTGTTTGLNDIILTLPVITYFSDGTELNGLTASATLLGSNGTIQGDTLAGNAKITVDITATGFNVFKYNFQYKISNL